MKIPYRWIQEFVELELAPEQAADRLLNAGIEVAGVASLAPDVRGVVVGEIEGIERDLGESHGHRLWLCRVSTGRERFSVVCGAPNTVVGLRSAFAPPGAVLPGGRRIERVKIRGAESQGMLCSERELGIGEEHEAGVLALEPDAPLGADLHAHLRLDDRVLEIEITPNRPDCLSVVGVARELAALTGARFRPPAVRVRESRESARALARVRIEDPALCARYAARVIGGVTVGPSPARLAARLRAVGLRPISNVVDVTNYVLWELGHPLHAFDHATVADATIVVRRARAGETLMTLDGQERELAETMLVIADPKRAIALAGVMGGANTEVTDGTTRVLLESAYFDPASVRRTSRALGLSTDATYRFERGADIEALRVALDRAAQLIADLSGGAVARGVVDAYPRRRRPLRLRLRMARVRRVLGVAPTLTRARRILAGLGLPTRDRGRDLEVEVPSFRRDLGMEDDLVEELIRVWGYDKIPSTLPGGAINLVQLPPGLRQEREVRRALVGAGLTEIIAYAFTDPDRDAALGGGAPGAGDPVLLRNPLSRDASLLRRWPLDGVLAAVATNARRRQPDVGVFEVGKCYERVGDGSRESRWLAVALAGASGEPAWWAGGGGGPSVDVYAAKGLAEHVLDTLGVEAAAVGPGVLPGFEVDCHGTLRTPAGVVVADFGEVAERARVAFGIEAPVFAAAVPLDTLLGLAPQPRRYEPLPRFPAVQRDVAFVVESGQDLTAARIEAAIVRETGPLLREVRLFDLFPLPDGRRSLAWRLTFQAEDRTLTDEEVNTIHERLVRRVADELGITWRGT